MIETIKKKFDIANDLHVEAEIQLKKILPAGAGITFRRGNMQTNHNAMVLAISGRRVKIYNEFTGRERWIDFEDIQSL